MIAPTACILLAGPLQSPTNCALVSSRACPLLQVMHNSCGSGHAREEAISSNTKLQPEPRKPTPMKKWQCIVCGLIYDEAEGWPDDGIAPGTRWEDVPEDWLCPDCGVGKSDFEMISIG